MKRVLFCGIVEMCSKCSRTMKLIRLTKLFKLFKTAAGSDIPLLLWLLFRFWCFLLWFCSLRSFSLEPFSSSARSSGDAVMFFGVSGVFRTNLLSNVVVGIRISSKLRFAVSFSLLKFFFECLSLVSDDVLFGDFSTDKWLSSDNFLLSSLKESRSVVSMTRWSTLLGYRLWLIGRVSGDVVSMSGTGLDTVLWCIGTGSDPPLFRAFDTRLKNPLPREPVESSEQFDFFTLKMKICFCHKVKL